MNSLLDILRDIEDVVTPQGYTSEKNAEIELYLPSTKRLFADIGKGLDKYHHVEDDKPTGVGFQTRKIWTRPKWEPDDILRLRWTTIAKIGMLTSITSKTDVYV